MTNAELYGDLPRVSDKTEMHRLRLAGHCVRHPKEVASQLILWEPIHGKTRRVRKQTNFVDVIRRDTNLDDVPDIRNVMTDRDRWKEFVGNARSGDRPN